LIGAVEVAKSEEVNDAASRSIEADLSLGSNAEFASLVILASGKRAYHRDAGPTRCRSVTVRDPVTRAGREKLLVTAAEKSCRDVESEVRDD
jgi:hypothetical protein